MRVLQAAPFRTLVPRPGAAAGDRITLELASLLSVGVGGAGGDREVLTGATFGGVRSRPRLANTVAALKPAGLL